MKISHLASSAGVGGGERYLLDLIRYADPAMIHRVILPEPGPFTTALQQHGIACSVVDLQRQFAPGALLGLIASLHRNRVDLLHTHGYRANFYGRLAALACRIPHICTIHVSLFDYRQTARWQRSLYLAAEKGLSPISRRIICVSGALRQDLQRLGIARRKLLLVHNGIDLHRFYPHAPSRRLSERLGLSDGSPVIGTVGRLVPEKGHIILLQALVRLQRKWPGIRCIIVGSGPLKQDLMAAAVELGVDRACCFCGTLSEIEQLYPLLDVFVLPSLREPFGLVLLEAMASGVPVVATAAGGPPEFIRDNVNGLLAPPGNSRQLGEQIDRYLNDPDLAGRLAAAGTRTVRARFDVTSMVARVERIYRSIACESMQHGSHHSVSG